MVMRSECEKRTQCTVDREHAHYVHMFHHASLG